MARYEQASAIHAVRPPLGASALAWSAPLGRWLRVPVRIHLSLAVVLVLAIGACIQSGTATGWLLLATYLTSLFVHESAHVFAAAWPKHGSLRSLMDDPLIMGPFGGLRVLGINLPPRERVFVAMAGPVASLALVVASMCVLTSVEGFVDTSLLNAILIDPSLAIAASAAPGATPLEMLAPLLVVINWPLFLLNLIPASPFDGGVAFRSWLSVWMGKRAARDATCLAAFLIAAGLLGAGGALVLVDAAPEAIGAALATLAVVVAFGARADAFADHAAPLWPSVVEDDLVGSPLDDLGRVAAEDLVAAELSVTQHSVSAHRDEASRDDSGESDPVEELWDDARVDDVLAKVHANGVEGLTATERAILQHASRRYQRQRRP